MKEYRNKYGYPMSEEDLAKLRGLRRRSNCMVALVIVINLAFWIPVALYVASLIQGQ